MTIDLNTFDLWETPATYDDSTGYWNVTAIFGAEYGCTLFLSSGFVASLPGLQENQTFSAILFKKAFVSRSANNHGYLAAILKAEKVIGSGAEQSTLLGFLSFDCMKGRINHLKGEGVDLPDHVAAELKARDEKKQLRRAAKLTEQKDEPVKTAAKRGRPKKEVKES